MQKNTNNVYLSYFFPFSLLNIVLTSLRLSSSFSECEFTWVASSAFNVWHLMQAYAGVAVIFTLCWCLFFFPRRAPPTPFHPTSHSRHLPKLKCKKSFCAAAFFGSRLIFCHTTQGLGWQMVLDNNTYQKAVMYMHCSSFLFFLNLSIDLAL